MVQQVLFKDIIGQTEIKSQLINEVQSGRISHAKLICGNEGVGTFPIALAYAQYLLCTNRQADDACGVCPSCVKVGKLIHPDLHFFYPTIKSKLSDYHLPTWRKMIQQSPYFNISHWLEMLNAENQQAIIYSNESDEIIKKDRKSVV